MNELPKPGSGLLFMKVGTHAKESLADIIERKTKEIEQTGYAMWGYGGSTCHPSKSVQPYARDFAINGKDILLCMESMNSNHFAETLPADEYSLDGNIWKPMDKGIKVTGSRYALVIKNLRKSSFQLPLQETTVAVGNSRGAKGSRYIRGRVDKACLEYVGTSDPGSEERNIEISLVAELADPYAVFVRNSH